MSQPLIALQLYSLREETKADFALTVQEVARMGYAGVELAGYGNLEVQETNRVLRGLGLPVSAMHVSRELLRDQFERVVDEALLLGAPEVICPWWPAVEFVSVNAVEQIGQELDAIGSRLRSRGLQFSYHVHQGEFRSIEGSAVISWMLGAAAPRNLGAQLDVYWAHVAGYTPVRFLYEQGSRVRSLHLKDEKVIGEGPVNFAPIFAAVDQIGAVEWYVVEQEAFDDAPLNSVRRCLEQLRAWGK